ncbi:MAG: GxxExxY protein [Saprospiraceae bacterium]|nr:GxxExxY protein [Candidatus Brachybacter algidus]
MELNQITDRIISFAISVHKVLGPGLLESAYKQCLFYELSQLDIIVEKEKPMPKIYKEVKLGHGYRMDLVVEKKVVIEIKTVDSICDVHKAQLLTYLKLGDYKLGLILNFKVMLLKDGITRIIN